MPQGSNKNSLIGLQIGWKMSILRRKSENQKKCKICGILFNKTGKRIRSHCSIRCKAESQKKENILTKKEYNKIYYQKNHDKLIADVKIYRKNHRTEINQYQKTRRSVSPAYRLSIYLRNRLNKAIKRNQKAGSAVRDLGCTIPELITYLEKQFKFGMTWENHGKWHIDHKIPLTNFDLINRQQFLDACHYTNLQPLWAIENIKKSNKYELQTSI